MKKHAVQILMAAAALAAGMAYHRLAPPRRHAGAETIPMQGPATDEPRAGVRAAIPPRPKLAAKKPEPAAAPGLAAPQVGEPPGRTAANQRAAEQYWRNSARRFEQQGKMLVQENDPAKRMNLIGTMARNVRIDTPGTLDWAMGLEDPAERRAALDAIGKNALVGIGARIRTDETGLPKIVGTTVLSALASTGMAEPGDYISGMVNSDGATIYFKGRPLREIVQLLRGQPGTEMRLLMERAPADGDAEPYTFDVPVLRSMIVVEPLL